MTARRSFHFTRRWPRFRLRSLLIAAVLTSLGCGWLANVAVRAQRQREAVLKVESLGGQVSYEMDTPDWSRLSNRRNRAAMPPPGPPILGRLLGDDAFARVESVSLSYHRIRRSDDDLALLAHLPHLKSLSLDYHNVTDASIEHVARLPELRKLQLEGANADDTTLMRLSSCVSLEELQLDNTRITEAGLEHLKNLQQLRVLSIDGARLHDDGLATLEGLPKLEVLRLQWTRLSNDCLRHIGRCRGLKKLALGGMTLSEGGLSHLQHLPNLVQLDLNDTKLTDGALEELTQFTTLKELRVDLDLRSGTTRMLIFALPECEVVRDGRRYQLDAWGRVRLVRGTWGY